MNVPVAPDGSFKILPPVSRPGDHVSFRAELDCVIALSACPVDMLPLNGPDCRPQRRGISDRVKLNQGRDNFEDYRNSD